MPDKTRDRHEVITLVRSEHERRKLRGKVSERAMGQFFAVFPLAIVTGHRYLAEDASRYAADALAAEGPRDGWPFFVRVQQALEGAGLT